MSNKIIEAQKGVYRSSFIEHGDTPKGTRQNDNLTQHIRYERIFRNLIPYKPSGFSVHDIGSGLCDTHQYLLDSKISHTYSGTEIVEEMNEASRKKFPNIKLYDRDFINDEINEKYDFVVCCGTFYIPGNVPHDQWKAFVKQMILKMFERCEIGISFNFLTTYKTFTDPTLFYWDPSEVLDFCMKELSRFVVIDHASPLFECTATVYKKGFLKQEYNQESLQKYFKS